MKSGTSNRNISFAVHNLLTFAVVIGLQNHFLYKITETVTVAAVALPQTQAVVETTARLVESFQFNAFDTTRTTSASSSLLSSSSLASTSTFEGAGDTQKPSLSLSSSSSSVLLSSSASLESSVAYPTSTTLSAFHNTTTSRIMSNIKSISPTSTTTMTHTTFKTSSSSSRSSTSSSTSNSSSGDSGSTTKMAGIQQNNWSSSRSSSSGGGAGGGGLSLFKNIMKSSSSSTITASNKDSSNESASSGSSSRSGSNSRSTNNGKQQFPLDFTFSKNHWTISDAAVSGGVGAGIVATGGGGSGVGSGVNHRLASSSAATSSSSSSISAYSSSASASASSSSVTETERPRIFRNKHHHERHWGPFFEEPLNSTTSGDNSITTAHLYTEAVLNCRVGMLKDKTVMWVRRTSEKVSLLTVGNVTYSSDPRIRVKFQYPNNWRLLINPTQWDDAGIYMCQVSTHPPRVFTTNLTVIEPPLRLIDDQERDVGDRYYKTGSTIDLQCQVSRSFLYKEKQNIIKSLKPLNVYNTSSSSVSSSSSSKTSSSSPNTFSSSSSNNKNQTKMTTNNNKNNKNSGGSSAAGNNDLNTKINKTITTVAAEQQGISLEDEFSNLVFWSKDDEELPSTAFKRISSNDKWLTSRVTITDAKLADTGNYSCSIGRLFTAIVQVQVLTGELPAAVQHNSAAVVIVCNISIRQLIQLCWIYITATYFVVN